MKMVHASNDGSRLSLGMSIGSNSPDGMVAKPSTTVFSNPNSVNKFVKFMDSKKEEGNQPDPREQESSTLAIRTKVHIMRVKRLIELGRRGSSATGSTDSMSCFTSESTDHVSTEDKARPESSLFDRKTIGASNSYSTSESTDVSTECKARPKSLLARKNSLLKRFQDHDKFRNLPPVEIMKKSSPKEEERCILGQEKLTTPSKPNTPNTNSQSESAETPVHANSFDVSRINIHWDTESVIKEQTKIRGILENRLGTAYVNRVRESRMEEEMNSASVSELEEVATNSQSILDDLDESEIIEEDHSKLEEMSSGSSNHELGLRQIFEEKRLKSLIAYKDEILDLPNDKRNVSSIANAIIELCSEQSEHFQKENSEQLKVPTDDMETFSLEVHRSMKGVTVSKKEDLETYLAQLSSKFHNTAPFTQSSMTTYDSHSMDDKYASPQEDDTTVDQGSEFAPQVDDTTVDQGSEFNLQKTDIISESTEQHTEQSKLGSRTRSRFPPTPGSLKQPHSVVERDKSPTRHGHNDEFTHLFHGFYNFDDENEENQLEPKNEERMTELDDHLRPGFKIPPRPTTAVGPRRQWFKVHGRQARNRSLYVPDDQSALNSIHEDDNIIDSDTHITSPTITSIHEESRDPPGENRDSPEEMDPPQENDDTKSSDDISNNESSKQAMPLQHISFGGKDPENDDDVDGSSTLSSTIVTLEAENRDLKRQLASMMELLQQTDACVANLQETLRGSRDYTGLASRKSKSKKWNLSSRGSRHNIVRTRE